MTDYNPPTEDLPIFDSSVFLTGDQFITQNQADKRYLRYPNAQGTENLQAINVNGASNFKATATFDSNIVQNSSFTLQQTQLTNNTDYNNLKRTVINGDLDLKRPSGANGGALQLWDVTGSSNKNQMYTTGNSFLIINLNNTGVIRMRTKDSLGNNVDTITATPTQATILKPIIMNSGTNTDRTIQTTFYTLNDKTTAVNDGSIYADNGIYYYDNNINSGSHLFHTNNSGGVQTTPLQITSNDMTIATVNPPTQSAVQPAASDSSTKIPTTAWVQSAITAALPAPKIYTTFHNTNAEYYTLPSGCFAIDIVIIGAGGLAGLNKDTGSGVNYYSGGSGAGGNIGIGLRIPLGAGKQLFFNFSTATGSYSAVTDITAGVNLARVYNGGAGTNATTTAAGTAGQPNTTASSFDTTYTNWMAIRGLVGQNGSLNAIPTTAGTPKGYLFVDGNVGCGQRTAGGAVNGPPATALGAGGCYITHYIYP